MTERRERREYSEEFKRQVVNLYNNGKRKIIKEYELTPSALNNWICRVFNSWGTITRNKYNFEFKLIVVLFIIPL